MKTVALDLSRFSDRRELLDHLAEELSFPPWFGRNLDALYDCLTDISEDTRLVITHAFEAQHEPILEVIRDACEANFYLVAEEWGDEPVYEADASEENTNGKGRNHEEISDE